MNKARLAYLFFLLLLFNSFGKLHAQIEGLEGISIFLDPGHSQKENMGLYNYSEAEKVLKIALEMEKMFQDQTDISDVYLSRQTDEDYISLEGRTTLANELGADFYYSIHSDAGASSHNSTLMLYGGWRKNGETVEKTPSGGAEFGEILKKDLTGAMRISSRGNWADRNFYLGAEINHHENQWPYLYVNRTTNMASLLSEGGFHTNPRQQQLNMNAEWKKLEALSAFRSFLEFQGIKPPEIGVLTGIVVDSDTQNPINGALISVGNQKYFTDTYEGLFHKYTSDPDKLSNGFYWLEGLMPDAEVEVEVSAQGYEPQKIMQKIASNPDGRTHENLTFLDVNLVKETLPLIELVSTDDPLDSLVPGSLVEIVFNTKMNRQSVEKSLDVEPGIDYSLTWKEDSVISLNTDLFNFDDQYTIKIDGGIAYAENEKFLDGDEDGNQGGVFEIKVQTSEKEILQPAIYPNPVKDLLTVEADWTIRRISVFNMQGKLVKQDNFFDNSVVFSTSNLSPGAYIIRVRGSNDTFSRLIMVAH